MVALLPPYVETAPQLCQFEGSEIDDFWSNIDGFGVNNRKKTVQNVFFDYFPSVDGGPQFLKPQNPLRVFFFIDLKNRKGTGPNCFFFHVFL